MSTTKYNLLTIFILITISNAKNIKLEIDSGDLINIISSLFDSDTIQRFASQIMRRSINTGPIMFNPYHPEDSLVTETKIETKKSDNKDGGDDSIDHSKEGDSKESRKQSGGSLEIDNENFIKGGAKSQEQVLVADSASPDEVKLVPADYVSNKNKNSSLSQKPDDMQNFRKMQRRFELKIRT